VFTRAPASDIVRAVKAKHLVPNLFTLANISCGFFSMLFAAEGLYRRAVVMLFFAALCDLLDGKLARMLDASTEFGMQLDSLSDAVSFGIAPSILVYFAVLKPAVAAYGDTTLGALVAGAVCLGYTLTAVVRLARYNVESGELAEVTFEGMPTPIAAGYMMSFVLVRESLPVWAIAAGVVLIAVLMVSKLKIPKFRPGGLPFWMIVFGIFTFTAFMLRPTALTWHVWNGWNLFMVGANYVSLSRKGYLGGASVKPEVKPA
jgi:CDP-diacylglycerol--serine O-phosphatidyltransferase